MSRKKPVLAYPIGEEVREVLEEFTGRHGAYNVVAMAEQIVALRLEVQRWEQDWAALGRLEAANPEELSLALAVKVAKKRVAQARKAEREGLADA